MPRRDGAASAGAAVSREAPLKSPPVQVGDAKMAVFSDTCGNWIALTRESTG
ncbi:MAG: hypothetical protein GY715_00240 [Planctomycetes bacterium]|nr:hypothetical protein [Planctomycetota bacterium]